MLYFLFNRLYDEQFFFSLFVLLSSSSILFCSSFIRAICGRVVNEKCDDLVCNKKQRTTKSCIVRLLSTVRSLCTFPMLFFFSCCAGCSVILYSRYFIYALRESKRPAREKIKELSNVFSRMGAMWFSAWKIPKTLYFVLLQCVLSLCVILYEAQHIWGYTYCITMFQSSAFAFYLCTALRFFFYSLQMMQKVENRQNSIVYRWLVCVAHGKLIVHSIKKNSVCKGWKCKLQFRRCWRCENVECSKATNKATLTGTNCKCCLR